MTRAPAAIHAARLARDEARISADLARLGPAASLDPAALGVPVDALLARPRAIHAWECWRCGDRHETAEKPQKVGGKPYCGPCVDHVRGVERGSGPAPVAREPIQADTPLEAPACPIGEQAAPTVAAEEGETGMGKTETKRSAPKREPVGPARRPCGCGLTGRHLKTCALAPKEEPGVHVCPDCGKDCLSRSGLGGHMAWCEKRKERLAKEAAPVASEAPAPVPPAPGTFACAGCDQTFKYESDADEHRGSCVARKGVADKWVEPGLPSLRCLVVRVRGAVPLEVECATPEDAAAFVRLVSAGGVS